jgi:peptidoglycan hydrolase CwlO-like protein
VSLVRLVVAAASGGTDSVTLITGVVLAIATVVSALTPIVLARRRARKQAIDEAVADAMHSSDLTLASWTALNAALQAEVTRLQGVIERMQSRIDMLEAEISTLQKIALGLQKRPPGG